MKLQYVRALDNDKGFHHLLFPHCSLICDSILQHDMDVFLFTNNVLSPFAGNV